MDLASKFLVALYTLSFLL
jgi:hypothetical protein